MAKKVLTMFSFLFVAIAALICSDIVSIQLIHGELDNISTNIGYYISKNGGINDNLRIYVKKEYSANLYCGMEDCSHIKKGDIYTYILEKNINVIFMKNPTSSIKIERSVIIGQYT